MLSSFSCMWSQQDRVHHHTTSVLYFQTDEKTPFILCVYTDLHGCCHSITYAGLTNSSACAESVYTVLSLLPEGNKHFTTITAFTCKQCLADVCTAMLVNSSGLGGYSSRKWGRMWPNVSTCCSFHLLSLSHPSLPVLLFCSSPHTASFKKNKSVAATMKGEKVC